LKYFTHFLADKFLGRTLILTKTQGLEVVKSKHLYLVYGHFFISENKEIEYKLLLSLFVVGHDLLGFSEFYLN
jgi:hypothetical protein